MGKEERSEWERRMERARRLHRPSLQDWGADNMVEEFPPFVEALSKQDNYQRFYGEPNTPYTMRQKELQIPVLVDAATFPTEDFHEMELNRIPCVIQNLVAGHDGGKAGEPWPAQEKWQFDALLNDPDLADSKFKCGEDDDERNIKIRLDYFIQYTKHNKDDSPLYIFDSAFDEHEKANRILTDYRVPSYFQDDLFSLVSESRRPPYRWWLIGPERSGTCVHIDPLATSAWNTLVVGQKRWVLFPPHVPKSVVKGNGLIREDEDDEAIHYFMYILPRIKRKAQTFRGTAKYKNFCCYEFTQNPGETCFIPQGWWHAVLNLTDTVAITQNFCSPRNFDLVWQKTRSGRKRMAWKWLCQLEDKYPDLAERAKQANRRDHFIMKYDPVEMEKREREQKQKEENKRCKVEDSSSEGSDSTASTESEEDPAMVQGTNFCCSMGEVLCMDVLTGDDRVIVSAFAATAWWPSTPSSCEARPASEEQPVHPPTQFGMMKDAKGSFHQIFPRRQLWHPKVEYPLWDPNWDGQHPPSTGNEDTDRQRMRNLRKDGVTRHIILIRHGQYDESEKEDSKRILTELGRKQADFTGKRLRHMISEVSSEFGPCNVKVVRVSDMARAKETADIIASHLPGVARAEPDPDLNEGRPCHNIPGGRASDSTIQKTDEQHARIEGAFQKYFHRAPPPDYDDEEDEEPSEHSKHEFEIIVCHANVIRNPKLVAAVSNSGGVGILATGPLNEKQTRAAIQEIRSLTDKPFGIGATLLMPGATENAKVALEEEVPVINVSLGKAEWIADGLSKYGGKLLSTVTNQKHAKAALEAGTDAFMVTGHEAAAHGGDVTSLVLVPSLRQHFPDVPIVAAGGFANGMGLHGALSLGADAVAMGSRMAVTQESPLSQEAKEAIVASSEDQTLYGSNFDGIPARVLQTPASKKAMRNRPWFPVVAYRAFAAANELNIPIWKILPGLLTQFDKMYMVAQMGAATDAIQAATVRGDLDRGVQFVGQCQGLINDIPVVDDLVQRIMHEALEVHEAQCSRFGDFPEEAASTA
eukprot:Nitzschia sp. Nitz4//scaffold121_size67750//30500//34949//NITZ4_006067-RA/size67750-processed-gene-0.8-mRNA-1//1//CDS//3329534348//5815//frame0